MGQVVLKMSDLLHGKVQEDWLPVQPCPGCSTVSGDLLLKISVAVRKALSLKQRESLTIPHGTSVVACGLGWDVLRGGKAIDLDTSCVAVSFKGEVRARAPSSTVAPSLSLHRPHPTHATATPPRRPLPLAAAPMPAAPPPPDPPATGAHGRVRLLCQPQLPERGDPPHRRRARRG